MWMEKLKRSNEAPWQSIDDQALILQPRSGKAHELNATAAWFWVRFDGDKTLEDLMLAFAEEFDCEEDSARREILAVVTEMRELRILNQVQE